jgi:capsular exopolysaccharide synthesis family protein
MDPENQSANTSRAGVAAQFFSRLHRWLNILRQRWWVILLGVCLAVGVELYRLEHTPPSFVSTGKMIVSAHLDLGNIAASYNEELVNFMGTQAALMAGDTVTNKALVRLRSERPDLQATPVSIEVTFFPKTSIFNLKAVGGNPEFVSAFLQADMDAYVELKKGMQAETAKETSEGLSEVLAQMDKELLAAKNEKRDFEATNEDLSIAPATSEYLANLTREIEDLKYELNLLKTLNLEQIVRVEASRQNSAPAESAPPAPAERGARGSAPDQNNAPKETPSRPPPDVQAASGNKGPLDSGSEFLKAEQNIALLKADLADQSTRLRPAHPKIIALTEKIRQADNLLAVYRTQSTDQLKDRENTLTVQIALKSQTRDNYQAKALEAEKKLAEDQAMKDNIKRLQENRDQLALSLIGAKIGGKTPDSVVPLEKATPGVPAAPPTVQRAMMAAAIGLVLSVALLLFLDRLDDRPNSFVELQDLFDENVLGQIPHVHVKNKKSGVPLLQEDDERHALMEAYRNLRSSIVFHSSPDKQPRIILVTSAIPGDGKSMTAANLAITLARSGSRVLLMDADLRRGLLHKHFDLKSHPGLAEVLSDQCPWTSVVAQNSVPNLSFVPRGSCQRHPGELFTSSLKEKILREASEKFDFVVIDTPPVMDADDVSSLVPHVDGVLMVIRANHTSGRVARAALDLLYLRKTKILGLVFNGVRTSGGDYYYYKYKEYYSKAAQD